MRFGIHLSAWLKAWDDKLISNIERVADIGYHGVEIPLMNPDNFPTSEAKKELERNDLNLTTGTGLSEETDITSDNPEKREAGRRHLKKCIEISSELGSSLLGGVIYAPWGKHFHQRGARYDRFISEFRQVAKIASENDVKLALEIINRYETNFLNTVDQGKETLADLNSNAVGLHLDTYHANIEETSVPGAIRNAGDDLFHLHVASNCRTVPGTGHLPWKRIKEALTEIDYDGWITVESFMGGETEVGRDTYSWRSLSDSPEDLAADSLSFLENLFY